MSEDQGEHVRPEHLFALIWAHREEQPPENDLELGRMYEDLGERYQKTLAHEFRLGPETAASWWEHARTCTECRCLLLEDGPSARPPKTQDEIAVEEQKAVDEEARKKRTFFVDLTIGIVAFGGAFACITKIREKEVKGDHGSQITPDPRDMAKHIDPLWAAFVVCILVASWFLAEAYTLAKDLWIDFTAWKRAVPVVGKAWAERSAKEDEPPKRIDGE